MVNQATGAPFALLKVPDRSLHQQLVQMLLSGLLLIPCLQGTAGSLCGMQNGMSLMGWCTSRAVSRSHNAHLTAGMQQPLHVAYIKHDA